MSVCTFWLVVNTILSCEEASLGRSVAKESHMASERKGLHFLENQVLEWNFINRAISLELLVWPQRVNWLIMGAVQPQSPNNCKQGSHLLFLVLCGFHLACFNKVKIISSRLVMHYVTQVYKYFFLLAFSVMRESQTWPAAMQSISISCTQFSD